MGTSWPNFFHNCKSRLSAVARSCFLSRQHRTEKHQQEVVRLREEIAEISNDRERLEAELEQLRLERDHAHQKSKELENQLAQQNKRLQLPEDPPAPGQQYGASMMALSINLARELGLRKATRAMKTMFNWLGVERKIPTYQALRGWMQRIGLDRMQQVKTKTDWVWLVDESNQIGLDRFLTILAIEQSKLPSLGTPLRHEDMHVLAIQPSKNWNRDNVIKLYNRVAQQYGVPVAIVTDGAIELREPAERLEKDGVTPRVIRDLKHFLANRFEHLLATDARYQDFMREINKIRSAIQQTELGHLIPPAMRQKSRFMNLQPLLNWSTMMLWQLANPNSDGRKGISDDRLQAKLGWLNNYKTDVELWTNYQAVISATLTFMNANGLYHGVSDQLQTLLQELATQSASKALVTTTVAFVREHEQMLKPGERLPMSTEVLESSYARIKALEQQHARSGFTQLILVFPTLLKKTTVAEIHRSFKRVKVIDIKSWVARRLPKTLDARRLSAYKEHRNATAINKHFNRATTMAA